MKKQYVIPIIEMHFVRVRRSLMAGSLDTSVQGGVNSVVNGGTFAEYGEYIYGNDNSGFIQYDGTGNGSDMGARHNPWNDKWEGL